MMLLAIVIGTMCLTLREVGSQSSPPEWHRLDDTLYLVDSASELPYDQAQSHCEEHEANLARIDSDNIQTFLTTFITPPLQETRCFWIGCNDREVEGQFKWLDGTAVIYDGWAPSQPNNHGGNQDCACLWSSMSENRHGLWDDDICTVQRNLICQKGLYDFRFTTLQSNPGFAAPSCAVDILIDGETLSPNDVRLSVGPTLSSSRPIPLMSTRLDGEFRNNTFIVGIMNDDDKIFCYVGQLPTRDRSFSRSTISPVFDFYELPVLTSGPVVTSFGTSSIIISWYPWTSPVDEGDGPVVSYIIYRQVMGKEWEQVGGIRGLSPIPSPQTQENAPFHNVQRRMEFILNGLEPDTAYNISVSAVREGEGGEGPRSPHVTVTTSNHRNTSLKKSGRVWISLFWISTLGNGILAVALVIAWKRREKEDLSRLRVSPPSAGEAKVSDHYEIPIPSAVKVQDYQGLQVGTKSNTESVYADIDDPASVDYANISADVQKHK